MSVLREPLPVARRSALGPHRQLQTLDIEPEILSAKDWQELTEQDYALVDTQTREQQGRKALSSGMIACAISHRQALEGLVSSETDMMVVVEDDVTLSADFKHFLDVVEDRNIDFDVIFLHRCKSRNAFATIERIGDYRLGLVRYSDWGAMGYIITRNAAQRFLERVPRIVHQIDHSLRAYWEHGLNTLSLDPPVVHHGNQSGTHSFRQEVQPTRHSRSLTALVKRLRTELTEDLRRRRIYRKRVRRSLNQASCTRA